MVSRLLTIITVPLSPWIFECTHGLKQSSNQSINQTRWSDFYKYIDRVSMSNKGIAALNKLT